MQTKKIPDTSGLVEKTDYNFRITEIESKIPTTMDKIFKKNPSFHVKWRTTGKF